MKIVHERGIGIYRHFQLVENISEAKPRFCGNASRIEQGCLVLDDK
jgi:hypothetical protein